MRLPYRRPIHVPSPLTAPSPLPHPSLAPSHTPTPVPSSRHPIPFAQDPWWNFFWCFVAPGIVSSVCWGETAWNGFFVPGAVRYVWVLHCTWLVNSAAHLYGERPYDPNSNPSENPLVSIASCGEGWHNWHHKYPFDYAASELGVMRQYNPTKVRAAAGFRLVGCRRAASCIWCELCAHPLAPHPSRDSLPSTSAPHSASSRSASGRRRCGNARKRSA